MKKNIALVYGGYSREHEISLLSSELVFELIDKELFNVFKIYIKDTNWIAEVEEEKISVDKNDFTVKFKNNKIKFDCAVNIIHGTPGEDGLLQAYFELLKIPYTACNFFESALTFDKQACKLYLKEFGVNQAKSTIVRQNEKVDLDKIVLKVGLPCFVKPNAGGSSFGTSKVREKAKLQEAIDIALEEDDIVIIEEFIEGRELTHGLVKTSKKDYILPITEIVSKNDFFDYEAKYKGESDEITPARVSEDVRIKLQKQSSEIYDILNCKGIVRIDYILKNNDLYFLEINTVPGMSKASIVPQQAREAGVNLSNVYTELINDAINK